MRRPTRTTLTLIALGMGAVGCAGDAADGPSPTATASPGGTGTVASCVVGDWQTTAVTGQASGGAASGSIRGGGGVMLTVGPDGAATADFTTMQPVTFTAQAAGADIAGTFAYAGRASGTISTGADAGASPTTTASPTGAPDGTSGTWEPVGEMDWNDVRVTVDLTEPVKARPVDNAPIGDYLGDIANQTGNVVGVDPLLGAGTYRCEGQTLVLSQDDGGIEWTLEKRAS